MDRLGLGELQRGHPLLPLDLVGGAEVEGLRAAAVAHHEVAAGVLGVDHGAVQADRPPARVCHLSLVPGKSIHNLGVLTI